jgi:hypothetical protein
MVCDWVENNNARGTAIGAGNKHYPNGSLTIKGPKRVELAGALGSDGQRNTALNW